jgi:hypothetical protein
VTPGAAATSYRNQFHDNKMGQAPDGSSQPNGVDFWWDQGGIVISASNSGNCWFSNTGKDGAPGSVTTEPNGALPSDCNNSPLPGGPAQTTELLTCSTLPQGDPSCPWFTTPAKP